MGHWAEAFRPARWGNGAGLRAGNARVSYRRSDKRLLEGKIRANILSLLLWPEVRTSYVSFIWPMVSRSSVHDDCGHPWEPHTLHGTSSPLLLLLCILLTFKGHHLWVWKIVFIEIILFELSWLDHFKTILALEKWPKRLRTADALAETLASILSIHVRQLMTSVSLVPGNLTPSSGLIEYCTHAEHIRGSWHIHRCIRKNKFDNFKNQ